MVARQSSVAPASPKAGEPSAPLSASAISAAASAAVSFVVTVTVRGTAPVLRRPPLLVAAAAATGAGGGRRASRPVCGGDPSCRPMLPLSDKVDDARVRDEGNADVAAATPALRPPRVLDWIWSRAAGSESRVLATAARCTCSLPMLSPRLFRLTVLAVTWLQSRGLCRTVAALADLRRRNGSAAAVVVGGAAVPSPVGTRAAEGLVAPACDDEATEERRVELGAASTTAYAVGPCCT